MRGEVLDQRPVLLIGRRAGDKGHIESGEPVLRLDVMPLVLPEPLTVENFDESIHAFAARDLSEGTDIRFERFNHTGNRFQVGLSGRAPAEARETGLIGIGRLQALDVEGHNPQRQLTAESSHRQ